MRCDALNRALWILMILLFNTDKLFKEHLPVLNKYQHRFHYLLVDEFQDTNLCQYFIIRKLASVQRKYLCGGR
jgi:superfamily I DNA/RNA helicase